MATSDKDKLKLLDELLTSWEKSEVSDFTAMLIVNGILRPATPNDEDIEWAKKEISKRKEK
jgi:hypothetical protein